MVLENQLRLQIISKGIEIAKIKLENLEREWKEAVITNGCQYMEYQHDRPYGMLCNYGPTYSRVCESSSCPFVEEGDI